MFDNNFKKSEETWDLIAESFNKTRKNPWMQVLEFIDSLNESDVVADIGCGNGRHLDLMVNKCKIVIGLDISKNLLNLSYKRIDKNRQNFVLIHGNLIYLPIVDNSLDAVLYIAALHNIKGKLNRVNSLKEVRRVLKKDGLALISVWSIEQEKFKHSLTKNKNIDCEFGDIDIYWRQDKLNVPRFYHLYSKEEFIKDIKRSKLRIEDIIEAKIKCKTDIDNYFAFVRK